MPSPLICAERIRLQQRATDKTSAIRAAGRLLADTGCIDPAYIDSLLRRETVANTFLGHGVAIPHGMGEDRHLIRQTGIAVLQFPDGLEWHPGQTTHLVFAIAAQSDEHITLLRRLTRLLNDDARLRQLFSTQRAEDIVAALSQDAPAPAASAPGGDLAERLALTLDYPSGLHARPAAQWVETARRFAARVQVRHGAETADAKNLVALLQLGLAAGAALTLSAEGPDARAALTALQHTIRSLTAQERAQAARDTQAARTRQIARGWQPAADLPAIGGIGASPGLAIGTVHVMQPGVSAIPDHPVPLATGGDLLDRALADTRAELAALARDTAARLGEAEAGIFKAQAELLGDTDLMTLTCQAMVEGHGVAWSWHHAVERLAERLAALGNPLLAARAADLRDVGRRVLGHLDPALRGTAQALPDGPCILVAQDLSPSDTAALDTRRIAGIVTAQGGPTSHTAILTRTLGIPAVVAAGPAVLDVASGTQAIVDGSGGQLYLDPDAAAVAGAEAWLREDAARAQREQAERGLPARTRDGHAVEIAANVNLPAQAIEAVTLGAEGVGLMRTEFLFLERDHAPDEDAQHEVYAAMLGALGGRPLIVRTLDIGGDKQVPHLNLPKEENPFLGVRGARLLLRRPDLMEPQLRALYRAACGGGPLSIMFPMITSLGEVIALRAACERIRAELDAPAVPLGIMVEVPAAALLADQLAEHVDFFSIGTNDLTQYTLAIDRQHPDLAAEADSLHPAVLRLIQLTVQGAARHGRWVGVCGGLAGDPFGALLLTGLGVHELSMSPRDIPAVKARLRDAHVRQLTELAGQALACASAEDVRALEATLPAHRAGTEMAAA
ncbi:MULTISPECIES: phosphoenolpyruvate--protein phosphotransferase [Ralstonia solanacearum species complex]|uniref:phosphoenolpyruvate--protein phosphotransferase n=5 Tax=Ralstonia solanacearum species complex TaxID=3116862 RepID=A0ABX7ZQ48_9RALS|nr:MULTISPECIES: phosphoenolpyruvate--protein phosphotransferase [Ralstonia solanacearum species complex]OHU99976.1 phosphoenolpyruvate--protein phosphotransferase [Ralstonia solanacearum]MDO3505958.1 phosphoenolpyruvate--protein phosphotransferase [Ralstonia pseudosolanacearum]MDO3511157.1 phosphoenolpyruvate--protein phosphotransferase [Ralstonia pseudosolanacearum]MDO3535651.1 phosphoenolpyruvate--protein phosphotransferase [Ralstonia pseudosolanacearum]MDO3555393.1 phosphoenolpyruvate--pro